MPNLLKKKEQTTKPENSPSPKQEKLFLTIILTDKNLQSSLVSNNGQGVQIKEFSEIKSYFDRKDLLDQLDISLQDLGPESEKVSKVVFAFDDSWLIGTELDEKKKAIIKDLTDKLSLEAIGQSSISEALAEARVIADETDSCLLLSIKNDSFDLIFLKHGKLLKLINIGRSNDMVADLQEALARATKSLSDENKYFPNKLLLTSIALNQKELNKISNALHKFDWTSNPGFLQEPGIVVLETDYMIKSISLTAGEVLTKGSFKLKMQSQEIDSTKSFVQEAELVVPSDEDNPLIKEKVAETEEASSFGIAIDKDLIKDKFSNKSRKKEKKERKDNLDLAIDNSGSRKSKRRSRFSRFYLEHKKALLMGSGVGLFSLIILLSIFSLFFSKVKVQISPDKILLQRSAQITLNPNLEESDFEKAILKASIEQKNITGEDVLATTGISLVGEKATGKVNIFNKTNEEKEFSATTVLSYNDISFSLDEDVKVASASETSSGSGTEYGKAEAAVTALDIGADANLNKDTKLRVSDYYDDSYSAVIIDTLSGGSSREIRVIAAVDRNNLLADLKQKLMEEAQKEFDQESKDGVYFLATGNSEIIASNFSGEAGEEVDSLSLDLSLDVESIKYLSSDLKLLAVEVLKQDLPENYQFVDEEPEMMTAPAESASNSSLVSLDAELMAKAAAEIDLDSLKLELLGKDLTTVSSILSSRESISTAKIIFNPPFIAKILKKLPNSSNRIKLEIID